MAEDSHPTYLSPSELGTKDYWETYYARTLAHIAKTQDETTSPADEGKEDSDINEEDDPGTSWFSEHNAPEKVLRFLKARTFPLSPRNTLRQQERRSTTPNTQPSILDLGTGNGSMLALMRKKGGFTGPMVGVDYSAQSIELARGLQKTRGHSAYHTESEDEEDEQEDGEEEKGYVDAEKEADQEVVEVSVGAHGAAPIRFEEWDILGSKAMLSPSGMAVQVPEGEERLPWFPYEEGGFDIVLDKGTFDAISLASDAKETRVCERYPDIVRRLIKAGGVLGCYEL
ncbi:S-adenosylmethionine-dependent methyltransferase [Penicillium chermesinum]|uniref:S-adenosylmethionine-dependent methyltransferase n=1 Tax=Penicillium chermesinum TaxID=63820 RepID=A0A9W9TSE0_9EURO|nr:S-adenosylmethionine-dependent methyltransferase [Penicillium chermesinum]KAJ5239437.1 S-adenosylmethionine-dependent methyltransferase [Penicillium chermesinum]